VYILYICGMGGPSKIDEWFLQSDYDFETAEAMYASARYIYAIFMCHLSLEKALKGLYLKRKNEHPVKSHDLVYFVQKIELEMKPEDYQFLVSINRLSVPTRYPDDLKKLIKSFTKDQTKKYLNSAKSIQQWIKQQ